MQFEEVVRLSFVKTPLFKDKLDEIIAGNFRGLIINCANLEFIDSSGISVLVSFIKKASRRGAWLKLCEANRDVKLIFEMINMGKLAEITDTESEMLEKLKILPVHAVHSN